MEIDKKKEVASAWFKSLRDQFCEVFEKIDQESKFERKLWPHKGKGGGEISIMKTSDTVSVKNEQSVALITIENKPVNALSHNVRSGVEKAIELVMIDDSESSIVIYCSGRTFCAGAY